MATRKKKTQVKRTASTVKRAAQQKPWPFGFHLSHKSHPDTACSTADVLWQKPGLETAC